MRHADRADSDRATEEALRGYEPPRVERALGPTELEREILYAGTDITASDG